MRDFDKLKKKVLKDLSSGAKLREGFVGYGFLISYKFMNGSSKIIRVEEVKDKEYKNGYQGFSPDPTVCNFSQICIFQRGGKTEVYKQPLSYLVETGFKPVLEKKLPECVFRSFDQAFNAYDENRQRLLAKEILDILYFVPIAYSAT